MEQLKVMDKLLWKTRKKKASVMEPHEDGCKEDNLL